MYPDNPQDNELHRIMSASTSAEAVRCLVHEGWDQTVHRLSWPLLVGGSTPSPPCRPNGFVRFPLPGSVGHVQGPTPPAEASKHTSED